MMMDKRCRSHGHDAHSPDDWSLGGTRGRGAAAGQEIRPRLARLGLGRRLQVHLALALPHHPHLGLGLLLALALGNEVVL